MSEEQHCLHAIVHGLVQGVNYRYFVTRCVAGTPITGWVRNLADGTVEVMAEGPRVHLETLLDRLAQGPRAARVTRVDARWPEPTGRYSRFEVRFFWHP